MILHRIPWCICSFLLEIRPIAPESTDGSMLVNSPASVFGKGFIFQSSKCFSKTLKSNKIGAFERKYIDNLNLYIP